MIKELFYNLLVLEILLIVLSIPIIFIYLVLFVDDPFGNNFCKRQGYDFSDWLNGGGYSNYYGKVTCVGRFDGNLVKETFYAKKFLGRFYLVSREGNLGGND